MMENGLLAIPREKEQKQSFIMALVVHLALLAFLWIGVSWQTQSVDTVQAEVWDIKVREAAPLAGGEKSALADFEPAQPEVVEEKRVPQRQEPVQQSKVDSKPDIALEQAKKKATLEKKKADAQKKADELKQKQDEQVRKKKEADEARQKKAEAAVQKRNAALLAQEAKRIARKGGGGSRVSGPTGSGGSGTAARSTGSGKADAGYIQKVRTLIKSNTSFNVPSALKENPAVEYNVRLLPDGSVRSIRKLKSSGVPGFDEAVSRAIEKSAPYPKDRTGYVPSGFDVSHKPKG